MPHSRVTAIALAGLLSLATCAAHAGDTWSHEATPFLWTAGLDGHVGFSDSPVEISDTFKDLVGLANVGAAMRITARRAPVGWFGEASWMEADNNVSSASGPVMLQMTQTFAEGGLLYELDPKFALYGGLRYQGVNTSLDSASTHATRNEGWIDAIAGVRWTPLTTDNWVTWARADAGGGSSKLVWLAEAGGGYRWGKRWSAYLSYRILDTHYEHETFLYDVQQNGLLIGFGFRY